MAQEPHGRHHGLLVGQPCSPVRLLFLLLPSSLLTFLSPTFRQLLEHWDTLTLDLLCPDELAQTVCRALWGYDVRFLLSSSSLSSPSPLILASSKKGRFPSRSC